MLFSNWAMLTVDDLLLSSRSASICASVVALTRLFSPLLSFVVDPTRASMRLMRSVDSGEGVSWLKYCSKRSNAEKRRD